MNQQEIIKLMKKNKLYRTNRQLLSGTSRRRIMLKKTHLKMLQRRKLFNLFNSNLFEPEQS